MQDVAANALTSEAEMSFPDALPLTGVRVADFSRVLAGPYCAMLLGDLGAEVIKVEHPHGDETRTWGPPFVAGESAYFLAVNRNKRSLTLDLKTAEGRRYARALVRSADVVLHNFKVGDAEKLGLGFAQLKQLKPDIIYCAISSFGATGPDAHKPGYDLLAQAMSGLMSITGEPDGAPSKAGVALIDVLAGLNAALGIVSCLLAKAQGATEAQLVETSLLQTGLSSLVNVASSYLLTGQAPKRQGNAHANIVPYQQFWAADKPLVIAAANDKLFAALARELGRPAWLAEDAYATNAQRVTGREALVAEINEILRRDTRDNWLAKLSAAGVPCGPVATLPEVFASAQVQQQGLVQRCAHPLVGELPQVVAGFNLQGETLPVRRPPPLLGEHQAALLAELAPYLDDAEL
jgi:crotonobetainyl-CoA:carnitine CoA-transferase CaiB-like acyl-CoA transferase